MADWKNGWSWLSSWWRLVLAVILSLPFLLFLRYEFGNNDRCRTGVLTRKHSISIRPCYFSICFAYLYPGHLIILIELKFFQKIIYYTLTFESFTHTACLETPFVIMCTLLVYLIEIDQLNPRTQQSCSCK